MKLSVVTTLYNSAPYIVDFHQRVKGAIRDLEIDDYEIIMVNDGSPDNSLEIAIQLVNQADSRVVVVDLSRNFGHHKAIMAGLNQAEGDQVFLIDSDLEESPEWLVDFSKIMEKESVDVVYGQQKRRKGKIFERWSGELYYATINWLCNIQHPKNIVTARLMTRRYVDSLLMHKERELVISCLWLITGYKQLAVTVDKGFSGITSYNLSRKIDHAVNTVTSFSEYPLKVIFYVGLITFMFSILYATWLVVNRILFSEPIDGWTSLMVSVWFFGGMITSFIGVIGIYLAKIFSETKRRPNTIIKRVFGKVEDCR